MYERDKGKEEMGRGMYLLRFSFNTLILGYKIIKFIGYMFQ
jgi:hypothetical protein